MSHVRHGGLAFFPCDDESFGASETTLLPLPPANVSHQSACAASFAAGLLWTGSSLNPGEYERGAVIPEQQFPPTACE